jgi:hypothetical protein
MMNIMDTHNHNNINYQYEKQTDHKNNSKYIKHVAKQVIIID